MINKVGAVVLRGGKLLLVREHDKDYWRLPGGRIEYGEVDEATLERVLWEELGVEPFNAKHYATLDGQTPEGENVRVFAHICDLKGDPDPSGEIAEIVWAGRSFDKNVTSTVRKLIERLASEGVLGE